MPRERTTIDQADPLAWTAGMNTFYRDYLKPGLDLLLAIPALPVAAPLLAVLALGSVGRKATVRLV